MIRLSIKIIDHNDKLKAKVLSYDNVTFDVKRKSYPTQEHDYTSWYILRKRIIRDFGYKLAKHKSQYAWTNKHSDADECKYLIITTTMPSKGEEDNKSKNESKDIPPPQKS